MNTRTVWLIGFLLSALATACAPDPSPPVGDRLANPPSAARSTSPASGPARSAEESPVIATVNDRPIAAEDFQRLVNDSYGLFVLEQLIALEMVRGYGRIQGVGPSQAEIDAEFDRSLRELARAGGVEDTDPVAAGRGMLDQFLAARNISMAEFKLSVERNAWLRKLVQSEASVTDDEVRAEIERRYGRQAVVRHMVLPDLKTVGEIRTRLDNGEDFAELARASSLHRLSGAAGGLLPAFAQGDPQVPALLRATAFSMQPGAISEALAIDGQYHLVRVEQFVESRQAPPDAAATEELRAGLRESRIRNDMERLERSLFKQAQIRISDPTLQERFRKKHLTNE